MPDFRRRDEDGREISHILIDDFLFSYWPDHATKVLMIVEIEDVIKKMLNQAPLPTPASVTPAADAPVAPPPGAAGR